MSPKHSLLLTAALPSACIFALFSLGCIESAFEESCTPGSYGCDTLTPEQNASINHGRNLLLGTWDTTYTIKARDDVDRLLRVGTMTWNLEIYSVDLRSSSSNLLDWKGVLRPKNFCITTQQNFNTQNEQECDTFDPTLAGTCTGHTCTLYQETEVSGTFDPTTNALSFSSANGYTFDLTHHNTDQGYINFNSTSLSSRSYKINILDDSTGSVDCDPSCGTVYVVPEGLYADTYHATNSGKIQNISMRRTSETFTPNYTVEEDQHEHTIGAPEYVNELLLGLWNVHVQLEGTDDVERPVNWGRVSYTLDIFEIERVESLVGRWDFKASLKARELCYVSKQQEDDQTLQCDTFTDTSMGRCSGAECTAEDELPILGRFNTLDNSFTLFSDPGNIHTIDEQGYIYTDIDISVEKGTLTGQTITTTQCTSRCFWRVNTAGAYEDIYTSRSGNVSYFSMERP